MLLSQGEVFETAGQDADERGRQGRRRDDQAGLRAQ
jgi:hypothetical protein